LFVGKVSRKQLKSTIRECFEEGRRYVIICLGLDPNEKEFRRGTAILKEELANAGFPNTAVDIWGQTQLIGMLKSFPGLCLRLSGHGNLPICTYEEWRSNEDMCTPLVLSTVQQGLIEEIRKALRSPSRPLIRVIGEPGVGKSRTVLEALCEHDLAPAVILVNDSDTFITSSLFHELGRSDVGFHAIVVVDDCSNDHRATIWNKFSSHRDRVQLILNGHEPEDVSGPDLTTVRCEGLEDPDIAKILESYVNDPIEARRWGEFCEGSPRVAHIVGSNLRHNPEDVFRPAVAVNVWSRFIDGPRAVDSSTAKQNRIVFCCAALFERFDAVRNAEELEFIARLAASIDPGLTKARCLAIVEEAATRRLFQGRNIRYISPRALHVWLFREFWDLYGGAFTLSDLLRGMPQGMKVRFLEMLRFAHLSSQALFALQALLADDVENVKRCLGGDANIVQSLAAFAEGDANTALDFLERWLTPLLNEHLEEHISITPLINALERIAVWESCFLRACELMIRIACLTSVEKGSPAADAFVQLFSLLPPQNVTQAPPPLRSQVIRQLLQTDATRCKLGLRALRAVFPDPTQTRFVGVEHQGAKQKIRMWTPTTWGELYDSVTEFWGILHDFLMEKQGVERADGAAVAVSAAWGLLRVPRLALPAIATLEALSQDTELDLRPLVSFLDAQLRESRQPLDEGVLARLRELDNRLSEGTFDTRIRRYVFFRDPHESPKYRERSTRELKRLADEAIMDFGLLGPYLPDLVRDKTRGSADFAFYLGQQDTQFTCFGPIVDGLRIAGDAGTHGCLAYFLSGMNSRDPIAAGRYVDDFLLNREFVDFLPILVSVCDPSDDRVLKTIDLLEAGLITPNSLWPFRLPQWLHRISEPVVMKMVSVLYQNVDEDGYSTLIEILYIYYCMEGAPARIPESPVYEILVAPIVFQNWESRADTYEWCRVAKTFVAMFPERAIALLSQLIGNNHSWRGFLRQGTHEYHALLTDIATLNPSDAWAEVVSCLKTTDPHSDLADRIQEWLGGERFDDEVGGITVFDVNIVTAWVAECPVEWHWWLVDCLPRTLDDSQEGALTRAVILRTTSIELEKAFQRRMLGTGWIGSEHAHYLSKRDEATKWLDLPMNQPLELLLRNYIQVLNRYVQSAEQTEEQERGRRR
jgi:hypothetical protein